MKRCLSRSAAACVLMISLVTVAFAQSTPQSNTASQFLAHPVPPSTETRNEKLKSDVAKMIAETKAGRRGAPPTSQFPVPQRNNLSKTAKIAIVAGIVLVVIAIIIVHEVKNIHCESRCVL
jgi:hypothetical protein